MTKGDATRLADGLAQLQLALEPSQQARLLNYLRLLKKWNTHFNLTAIAPSRWINELLLDALVAMPLLQRGPVLDVGSGAGLPGIPLAIACPQLHFTLLDSNGKKTRFIKQVVIDLQITNVDVVQSRIEVFRPTGRFAWVISRAFAGLDKFLSSTSHLLAEPGEWLAWKGENLANELARLTPEYRHLETIPIRLPGLSGQRNLVKLTTSGHQHSDKG